MKQNRMGYLTLVVALIGTSFIGSAMAFKEKVTFSVSSFRFDNWKSLETGYNNLIFNLKFDLINPSDFESEVKNISLNISYEKNIVARVLSTNAFKIKSKGATTLILPVVIDTKASIKNLPALASQILSGGITFGIKGSIELNYGKVNVDQTKTITV